MRLVSRTELEGRLTRFQERLRQEGIDCALVVQNVDLFYLAGTAQQGHFVVPADGEPVLLVRKDLDRARRESALENVKPLRSLSGLPGEVAAAGVGEGAVLGMELDVLPVGLFRVYPGLFPKSEFLDCSPSIRELRAQKTPFEMKLLEEAAAQSALGIEHAARMIREGMTEFELATHIQTAMRLQGHHGVVRFRAFNQEMLMVHLLSGPDGAYPSGLDAPLGGRGMSPAVAQGPGTRQIRRNEPVIVDIAGGCHGYIVDETRTLCLGNLPADLKDAYAACLEIHRLIHEAARPGATCGEVFALAAARAAELGYAEHFMGVPPAQVSFVGHGVGLEIDEYPHVARGSSRPLAEGNVIAFEPKLVFPDRGAVGIEDACLVTESGLVDVTFSDRRLLEL